MMETWRPISGYPAYEVSDHGRVRRIVDARNSKAGRILRPAWRDLYLAVDLCHEGKRRTYNVHRLVADAFLPPDPDRPEVNHKNGQKADCRLVNLERATRGENAQHAHDHGLQDCKGEQNSQAKLTLEQVHRIRAQAGGPRGTAVRLAREYGVSDTTIRDIWKGRTWPHAASVLDGSAGWEGEDGG